MQLDTIQGKIRAFLVEHFPLTREMRADDDLLAKGGLDSLGVLEVVTFLEREFSIAVVDEELVPENFRSVSTLLSFVQSKLNGGT
jgi:acyl carrier protein